MIVATVGPARAAQKFQRGGDVGARREAGENALFGGEPAGGADGLPIAHTDITVDVFGPKEAQVAHGIAAALNAVVGIRDRFTGQHRTAGGLHHEALDGRFEILEGRGATGEGAAGSDEVAERIDAPAGLLEHLRARVQIMRPEIAWQVELVRPECAAFAHDTLRLPLDQFQVAARNLPAFGAGKLIDQHDLGAKRGHHPGPLGGVPLGHDGHKRVPLARRRRGQRRSRVAARELDHGLGGLERSLLFGILDDLAGDPVLLGKAGVQVFQLGEDRAVFAAREPRKLDQRSPANRLDNRGQRCVVPGMSILAIIAYYQRQNAPDRRG